jgi:hypothetical protein
MQNLALGAGTLVSSLHLSERNHITTYLVVKRIVKQHTTHNTGISDRIFENLRCYVWLIQYLIDLKQVLM